VVFAGVIAIWYLVSLVLLDPFQRFLLPPPHKVIEIGFLETANLSEILVALRSTAIVSLSGFSLAALVGIAFAVLMSQSRWIERSFYPYAVALQAVPIVAMVPLIGLWLGFDFRSRVLVSMILAFFPIVTNTLFGILSVNREHRELFQLHGAGRLTRLARLEFPSALPSIFTGLRVSVGLSVIGAVVGDFYFREGTPGIGRLLDLYSQDLQTEELFATILVSSAFGLGVFLLVGVLSTRATIHWHESAVRS
jgi:NitT/TauT family transport system permease protein